MGRTPCCSEDQKLNRGAWTVAEDQILRDYIETNGAGKWRNIPKEAGLKRCGKSCRLRWLNYLRPDIKRGNISQEEEDLIIRLHKLLGNRWSLIAGRLPGRTDNEIKNYWNTTLRKKMRSGEQSKECKDEEKKTTHLTNVKPLSCTYEDQKVANTETQNSNRTDPSITSEETSNNLQQYSTQFNFGELLQSYTSDSEFWKQQCHFDHPREAESGRWFHFDQPVSFSEEMLKDWIADDSFL